MVTFNVNGQSLTIQYEERANIENQLKNVTDPETRKRVSAHLSKASNYLLYYEDGTSLYFQELKKDNTRNLNLLEDTETKKVEIGKDAGGVYKNHNTKEYLHEADLLGKKFLVMDELKKYDWELVEEYKTIGTYQVRKATAIINGEDVIAWYTLDIPIQDGPKDYYGLPGLIIELIGEKKTYHAVKVSKNKSKISITKPTKGQKINRENYNKTLNEKLNELKQGIGNSLIQ